LAGRDGGPKPGVEGRLVLEEHVDKRVAVVLRADGVEEVGVGVP
jgi:hypothetical protein